MQTSDWPLEPAWQLPAEWPPDLPRLSVHDTEAGAIAVMRLPDGRHIYGVDLVGLPGGRPGQ